MHDWYAFPQCLHMHIDLRAQSAKYVSQLLDSCTRKIHQKCTWQVDANTDYGNISDQNLDAVTNISHRDTQHNAQEFWYFYTLIHPSFYDLIL